MEYKAERASVPTRYMLNWLKIAYYALKQECPKSAGQFLCMARENAINVHEIDDIKSVYDLLDKSQEAMNRIEEILTCGGRIYDEYSDFLKAE